MRIGQWEIIKPLGSGGGGVVYLARDVETEQVVALKQMQLPPGLDPEPLRARFLREARSMAKINSDYVVRLYNAQIIDDRPTLVMEYVAGGSLGEEMASGPFSPEAVVRLLWEILHGLDAVHQAGVIHRDVKPGNILKSDSGRYKLADFGISGQIGKLNTLHAGSAQYAAPEYVADPSQIDGRADLYSVGLCAYEAALGRDQYQQAFQHHAGVDPFVTSAQWQAWLADPTKEVPPLHLVSPSLPLELSMLVSRLLAKDPARRFATCAAVLAELNDLDLAARANLGNDSGKRSGPTPKEKEVVGKKRSFVPLIAGVSVALTLAIIGTAMVLRPRPKPEPPIVQDKKDEPPVNQTPQKDPPPPPPVTELPKRDTWTEFERLADRTSEKLQVTNVRSTYGVGDTMSIEINLPRDGYLNVLTISDVTGTATVLFPNDHSAANRFQAGSTIRLPAPGDRYKLAFALPEGAVEERNLLVAFLTDAPVNARDLASGAEVFRELTPRDAGSTRGAIVAASYAAGKAPYLLTRATR